MKLNCPACNSLFTLDAALQGESVRDSVLHALALPAPMAKLMVQYLSCFAPKQSQLSWARVAYILGDLRLRIDAATVTHKGVTYAAPQEYFAMGLEAVLQSKLSGSLVCPIKDNAYLFSIIASFANKAAAKAETADNQRRAGIATGATHASHRVAERSAPVEKTLMPEHMRASIPKLKHGGSL
jgi:hypothetical protein